MNLESSLNENQARSVYDAKFNTISFLWSSLMITSLKKTNATTIIKQIKKYKSLSIKALYKSIVEQCQFECIKSTFIAKNLRQTLSKLAISKIDVFFDISLSIAKIITSFSNSSNRRKSRLYRDRENNVTWANHNRLVIQTKAKIEFDCMC